MDPSSFMGNFLKLKKKRLFLREQQKEQNNEIIC